MVDVTIREEITKTIENIDQEMDPRLAKLLLKAATYAGGIIQQTVDGTFKESRGDLSRSFLPARFVQVKDKGIAAAAVSDLPYARIQDEGGTIKPTGGRKYLTIPLTSAARNSPARDWPEDKLTFIQSKRTRNKFLAEIMSGPKTRKVVKAKRKRVKGQKKPKPKPIFHFLLREQVTLDGTDYLGRAMQAAEPEINDILRVGMQEMVDEADEGKK